MLRRLEVDNLAILEGVRLEFGPGLNVLTGETGAGKSLLLDALALALGARADAGLIRAGADALAVTAEFEVGGDSALAGRLTELGAAPEQGFLLLTREVAREGRSTCRLNGRLVTASTLRAAGGCLLTLAGQGEHHRFAQPAAQLDYLDAFAGAPAPDLRRRVSAAWAAWREAVDGGAAAGADPRERARQRDALAYAIGEIDALELREGEEERLAERRRVVANAERLLASVEGALSSLWDGEGAVRDRLGGVSADLGAAMRLDPALQETAALLEGAVIAVDEAARALRRYRDTLRFDPREAEALSDRWAQLQRCKRKYGDTVAEVLAWRAEADRQLAELDGAAERAARLAAEAETRGAELGRLAAELGRVRAAAAARLDAEIGGELAELGMPGARLQVRLQTREDAGGVPVEGRRLACTERGCDAATFSWAANPGEPGQPLGRVASGGELARLLLALFALRAEEEDAPTIVFDEVDAGIGGRAAAAVAARLQALGGRRQVLCVTHLGIIAAAADRHFTIAKATAGARTEAGVRRLGAEEREAEIARMLDGGRGRTSREHAAEMLRRLARRPAG